MYGTGSFAHTFSTLQKRPLLSKGVYDILTQAGPKKLAKKVKNYQSFGKPQRIIFLNSIFHFFFLCAKRGENFEILLRAKRGENFEISLRAKRGKKIIFQICRELTA